MKKEVVQSDLIMMYFRKTSFANR